MMNVPTEYPIIAMLVTAVGTLFALYQRGVDRQLAAKDADILWLRQQLALLLPLADKAVDLAKEKAP